MKTNFYLFSILCASMLFSCEEQGNNQNDNKRGGKTFEKAVHDDSAGREQTIDGEELKTDTTNIKYGEKNH